MRKIMTCALAAMMFAACGNKTNGDAELADSTIVEDSVLAEIEEDGAPMPAFLYVLSPQYMQVVYWTSMEEPLKKDYENDGSLEDYDNNHRIWALQEEVRRNAKEYTKVLGNDNKTYDIKYVSEALKDPDGGNLQGGSLHSLESLPSKGQKYAFASATIPSMKVFGTGIHVMMSESYLKTRKALSLKLLSPNSAGKPFSAEVRKKLEAEYGMTVQRSEQAYRLGDKYVYGVVQFKPKNKKVIALEVLTDGDKVYSWVMKGYYESETEYGWNVDDEGTYFTSQILAAYEGPKGLEICFERGAPESITVGLFVLKEDKFTRVEYACYYIPVDEQPPLWKKDLAKLRKMYTAEDKDNKNHNLTRYAWEDIDGDDIKELLLCDKDNKYGAIFTMKGEPKMVCSFDCMDNINLTWSEGGKGYVIFARFAGGPSVFTNIYGIKNSKVEDNFGLMEVYGEYESASLNGKEIGKEAAQSFMAKLPRASNRQIYYMDIDK